MALVHLAISIIVLGFLYRRMIIRETPGQIGKAQAVVPVFLGVISLPISFAFFILNGAIALAAGYSVADNHSVISIRRWRRILSAASESVPRLV